MSSEVRGWVEAWGTISGELYFLSHMYFEVWNEGSKRLNVVERNEQGISGNCIVLEQYVKTGLSITISVNYIYRIT